MGCLYSYHITNIPLEMQTNTLLFFIYADCRFLFYIYDFIYLSKIEIRACIKKYVDYIPDKYIKYRFIYLIENNLFTVTGKFGINKQ